MSVPRAAHTASVLPSGKVLVVGGRIGHATAELYDLAAETWSTVGSMATTRYLHTATLLPKGKVLFIGGVGDDDGILASAELCDVSKVP